MNHIIALFSLPVSLSPEIFVLFHKQKISAAKNQAAIPLLLKSSARNRSLQAFQIPFLFFIFGICFVGIFIISGIILVVGIVICLVVLAVCHIFHAVFHVVSQILHTVYNVISQIFYIIGQGAVACPIGSCSVSVINFSSRQVDVSHFP